MGRKDLDVIVQSHHAYVAAEVDFEEDSRTARIQLSIRVIYKCFQKFKS